ncbi:flagellar assembly protein FliH [Cytobacillus sp. FJAT-53684]|uniref:Flagellar assembly protein FliH n=1 Tax=Cytobacillus mangrovibacter TaxID=3299024 RepID=A0ABW6JTJ3_9BACI
MILLSRLIKGPLWAPPVQNEKKVISIKILEHISQEEEQVSTSAETDTHIKSMISDAQLQAEMILNEAQQEADIIRRKLEEERRAFEAEKVAIAEQSRQAGFSQGIEEGRQQGYLEYHEVIQSAVKVVELAKKDYRMQVDSSEGVILELGLKVAGKILGKRLQDNEEEFLSIVKRALKESRDKGEIQIHVHPVYYELLLTNKEEMMMLFPKDVDFYIYPNDDLSESSCIIESANGRIDASIDSQLEEVKQKLIEMLEGEC